MTQQEQHQRIYDDLKARGHILFETVIGSQAHGTSTPKSDVDLKFVYMAPLEWLYDRQEYHPHLELTKDYVGYELETFLNLVATNNPTILEVCHTSEDCWTLKHALFNHVLEIRDRVLSKTAKHSYLGYAFSQIKKAKGMKKFQNWSADRTTKKEPVDFCWVISSKKGYDTVSLKQFMEERGLSERQLGVTSVNHAPNTFSLFFGENFRGVFGKNSDQILFSSIPKEQESIGMMVYNADAYKMHSADWKAYSDWKENANRDRWVETADGSFIDAKKTMHLVRLFQMNRDIAEGKGCVVRRPNRDELLAIRNGERNLDEIIAWSAEEEKVIAELYEKSDLPETTDRNMIKSLLMRMRTDFYGMSELDHVFNTQTFDNAFIKLAASASQ